MLILLNIEMAPRRRNQNHRIEIVDFFFLLRILTNHTPSKPFAVNPHASCLYSKLIICRGLRQCAPEFYFAEVINNVAELYLCDPIVIVLCGGVVIIRKKKQNAGHDYSRSFAGVGLVAVAAAGKSQISPVN
jgi:hypothetical protein